MEKWKPGNTIKEYKFPTHTTDNYTQLQASIRRIQRWWEQKQSLFVGIMISIILLPLAFFLFYIPIIGIYSEIMKQWWHEWFRTTTTVDGKGLLIIFPFAMGYAILYFLFAGTITEIRIIRLLQELKIFNTLWKETHSRIENLDEILDGIESIHSKLYKLPILKKYADSKDSKYLFLQNIEIEYFYEILTNIHSDLQTRIREQQKTLEQAKSEVEENIRWTSELEQVSELQKARLDRQIEQFEELQRILIKV